MAYPQTTFHQTKLSPSSLLGQRQAAVAKETLKYQLDVLKKTGRYDAFKLKWHSTYNDEPEVWPIPNHLFWDSDVAKWIEGACYFLRQQELPEFDAAVRELVDMIRAAQQPDGYLNIHYTVVEPTKRFSNLRDMHELYNAGHLIEAALAHNELYGNDLLLEPIVKYVNLFCDTFGPQESQTPGYPGHPEIELALLRLYDRTKDPRHLQLARFFITERGNPTGCHGQHYYDYEADLRKDDPNKRPAYYAEPRAMWYHQAQAPIVEQQTVEGHSVRAMYLLTAVADLVRLDESSAANNELQQAYERLWDNMVGKKMYVTGGIGAIKQWEGFAQDYYMPQSTDEGGCYAETCAAIGVMMLANRALQVDLDARYGDVLELALYNAVLTAMSSDGKSFTYVNQLASSDTDVSKREDWFTVACCPPNVLRLLGQIGGYLWDAKPVDNAAAEVTVHLYTSATRTATLSEDRSITIKQTTEWPWDGKVNFEIETSCETSVRLRIPSWAKAHQLTPPCDDAKTSKGYLILPSAYIRAHPTFTLDIPMKPRWIAPHPLTGQHTVSLARGPIVYCVEDFDNDWVKDHFKSLHVDVQAPLTEAITELETTQDHYMSLKLHDGAYRVSEPNDPSSPSISLQDLDNSHSTAALVEELFFVPYYLRANRGGRGQMRVGLRRWIKPHTV